MNVFLESYVDRNIGDDIMLEMLVKRYPNVTFWTFGHGDLAYIEQPPYCNWDNFYLIGPSIWEELLDRFDGYIGLGGSMWQDEGKKNGFRIRSQSIRRMRELNKPCLMIGNNIGPVSTSEGVDLFVDLLERLDDITLRDRTSLDWIKSRSAKVNARLASDLVFLYPVPSCKRQAGLVGISVNNNPKTPERNGLYVQSMAQLVERLLTSGLRVRMFGFDSGSENDGAIIAQVLAKLPSGQAEAQVEQCLYTGDISGFLASFGECEHVFTSRFHSLILALRFGIPFTPFAYLNKTADFLKDLNYRGPLFDYDNLAGGVDDAVTHIRNNQADYDPVMLVAMKGRAERNFTRADQLLQGKSVLQRPVILQMIRSYEMASQAGYELRALKRSFSWRITGPLRWLSRKIFSR